jgi:hypothetical protein
MQKLGRAVFYGHNTFEVTSQRINERDCVYDDGDCWRNSPPTQYLQRLKLHVSSTTNIPGLLVLLKGCKSLKTLIIIIESVPKNYVETLASLRYQRPHKLDLVGVDILPAQAHREDLQRARMILLDVFLKNTVFAKTPAPQISRMSILS